MATIIKQKTKTAAIGTAYKPRVTVKNPATGVVIDLTAYTCDFVMKEEADETEVYVVGPVSCATDSTGKVYAPLTATTMSAAAVIAAVGKTLISEFVFYLSSAEEFRIQFRTKIVGRAKK